MTGWNWGGGVYLNDAMTLLWLFDAGWWNWLPASYERRPLAIELPIQGFFLFMVFNATVVFGSWPARLFGMVLCPIVGWLLYRATRNSPSLMPYFRRSALALRPGGGPRVTETSSPTT